MHYLLDSNVFIEAKNRYYGYDFCPGFWDWLDQAQQAGDVATITSIYDELAGKGDELSEWVEARNDDNWFIDVSDEPTQMAFADIAAYVTASNYTAPAKGDFLGGADPWLIAKARVIDATIITHETFDPNAKRKVFIPNVCKQFGVSYMDTFTLLRNFSASFVLG